MAMSLRAAKYKGKGARATHTPIELGPLHDVLKINVPQAAKGSASANESAAKGTDAVPSVTVEPNVTMGQLTAALLPLGWTLPVVPELDDLTIGGLTCGCGVETSSHRYGMWQHTCLSFELVVADGRVITCSPKEHPDLFYAVPWSHGTLGLLTAVELRIVPASSHVRVTYTPFRDHAAGIAAFEAASRAGAPVAPYAMGTSGDRGAGGAAGRGDGFDFVEALAFSHNELVLMTASYADGVPPGGVENRIGRWYKPWFFEHVRGKLRALDGSGAAAGPALTEYIPLRDYYHRHTRSLFWEMGDILPFGNHPIFRWLLGWATPPKPSLLKLTQTEELRRLYKEHHVVQDMLVPMATLRDAIAVMDSYFGVYPLWLCPMRLPLPPGARRGFIGPPAAPATPTGDHAGAEPRGVASRAASAASKAAGVDDMYVDVGAYGTPHAASFHCERSLEAVEEWVRGARGFQMLYADYLHTRPQFEAMFDHSGYREVRKAYGAENAFPEVYDKTCAAARV